MRRTFGREYIHEEFQRLGDELDDPLTIYLVGGGAMAFRELKATTKDVDVIVRTTEDYDRLLSALESMEYRPVREPDAEYEQLGAQAILENDDGCRFDVFDRQVVDKLIFSDGMERRSQEFTNHGNLTVQLVSTEDVFLFKAVAGRTADIEDMNTLVQTGLDSDTVLDELQVQTDLLDEELLVTFVNESLIDLEDRFGVTIPSMEPVEEIAVRVYDQLAILQQLDDEAAVDELRERTELSDERFGETIDALERKGNVERENGRIRKLHDRP